MYLCRGGVDFLITFSFSVLTVVCANAQKTGIAYYDLDHLYDTVPALFYNDSDYTPAGKLKWTSERYERKIRNTAAVVDTMQMPLVTLWSEENENVVRDIATACEGGYTYIHRTLNSLDGMDFALLYYGDVFFPGYVESGRRYLYVEGVLRRTTRDRHDGHGASTLRDTIGILMCSEARMAKWVVSDLREERPKGVKLIVAGRSAGFDGAECGLSDVLARPAALGRGNIRSRGGWSMRDRILVDTAFRASGGDVFVRRYMVDLKTGNPLPTYDRKQYRGGYGYALPVFTYFE